jgi:hypothetical protein
MADKGNTRGSCYPSRHYPFPHLYEATELRNYTQKFSALPMITSMDYEFANRKQFPSNTHVPFCPSATLCLSSYTRVHMHLPRDASPAHIQSFVYLS